MNQIYNKLTEEIKKNKRIILMAHRNIDLDALGSLLCLHEIIKSFNIESFIVMNKENNESVNKALSLTLKTSFIYSSKDVLETDLLIIVDTHKEILLENDKIFKKVKNIIVIDHHIKDTDYIKDTIFTYIDSNASSTVEIIIGYLKYLNKVIDSKIASIMLAGIEIDTNSFDIKTTDKTYETAAELYKFGADNTIKKELLQQNKEEYIKRQDLIKNFKMISDNMAVCLMDDSIYKSEELSRMANELLQFDKVEAGFAIGHLSKTTIGISAKSLGNIDVELIMKKLNGGGHANNAATQLKETSLKKAEKMLLETIKEDL